MRDPNAWARDREADKIDAAEHRWRIGHSPDPTRVGLILSDYQDGRPDEELIELDPRLVRTHQLTDVVGAAPTGSRWHCGDRGLHPQHALAVPGVGTVVCAGSPLPEMPAAMYAPGATALPAITVNVEGPQHAEPDEVPNRWLHVVVSLLTGGAWLLGWAVIELRVARRNRRRAAARLKAVRRGR